MTFDEKVAGFKADLKKRGDGVIWAEGFLITSLRAIGVRVKPVMFWHFGSIATFGAAAFGVGMSVWATFSVGLDVLTAAIVWLGALAFGLLAALMHRAKAKRLNLPDWKRYQPGV